MKTKFITVAFLFFVNICIAQKAKVQAAYNYLKYEQLDKAKEAIDEAALDDASMNMDKTWYYRGLIYEQIHNSDKFKDIAPNALDIALLSYQKAIQIDSNTEYKPEINARLLSVKAEYFNMAVGNFRAKDYNGSLTNFENVLKIDPKDSVAILYSGYSADRLKNHEKAIQHYQQMIALKYDDASIYHNLGNQYEMQKDTDRAFHTFQEGRKKYPDDLDLMLAEINVYLTRNQNAEARDLLIAAIQKDPKNATLDLALGDANLNLSTQKDAMGNAPKPEEKKDYLTKAADAYKKAIEVKPDYFEANFNLGILYYNQAADMLASINGIKDAKQYTEAKQRCDAVFAQAQPYLEKALDINPKDRDTLMALKQLYQSQNNQDKVYQMKDRLDALGK